MGRKITVDIVGDATRFNNATKSATKSAGKFDNVLKGIGQGIGISAFANIAGAASMAAGSVVDFARDSIAAASNLNETLSKSSVIFGDNAEDVAAWGKTMAEAGGLSQRAALDAASGFAGLFQTVGLAVDQSADMAQSLTTMGSDLASFFNTDVDTALQALKSGLSGESEPLRKFNVFLSETAVSAKLAEMGIKKVGGTFTEAQKATARYALIMEQTSAAQGDYARTADGLANSGRTLAAEMENLQAEIGQELLPTLIELSQWAREDGIPMLKDLLDVAGKVAVQFELWPNAGDEGWHGWKTRQEEARAGLEATMRATQGLTGAAKEAAEGNVAATRPTVSYAQSVDKLGDEAIASAKELDKFTDSLKDTTESLIAASREPEQLRLELALTKAEVGTLKAELDKLTNGDGKPVKGVTWSQVNEVKLALSEAEEKADLLRFQINSLDGVSLMDSIAAVNRLGGRLDFAGDKAGVLLSRLTRVGIVGANVPSGNYGARASGGPASGLTWVGEQGKELVDLPPGSYVHSNAESMRMVGSPSRGGRAVGGTVVNVNINEGAFIDGPSIDRLTNLIAQRLNYATGL